MIHVNPQVLVFIIGVPLFGVIAYYSYQANQKRINALQQFCLARGWTYLAAEPDLTDRWTGNPFNEGDSRKARNVIVGTWRGLGFKSFDYSFVTESSDGGGRTSRTTHHYGVVALGLPAYLPNLQVTGEGMLRRVAAAVGIGQDIQLESEDFNRAFTVTSSEAKFASDVLNPRTMQMLLASPHLAWRIEGTDILSWDSGTFSTVDLLQRLDHLGKVVAGVPTFVWHDHGYDPPQTAGDSGQGSAS
jgi:hypothetical protein